MAKPNASVGIRLVGISATFRERERGDIVAVNAVDLDVRPGELLTLLGPSGCGKTTMLRMIAGFQQPSAGGILIGERDVTRLPANRRDIGLVFQSYALFPHLTVFENVAYGLRVRRRGEADIRNSVAEVLRLVGLDGFAARLSNELSGGQQQRVALARAIVIQPRVLLFDEPLSNLDAKLRVEMRDEIRNLQRRLGITTVYVTHDQEEAMAISDRIAVMEAGRIVQLGTAEDLYRRPASSFVASFIGRANIIRGIAREVAEGRVTLELAGQRVTMSTSLAIAEGARVSAVVRPEALTVDTAGEGLRGTLINRVYLGDKVEYFVQIARDTLQIVRSDPPEVEYLATGQEVVIRLPGKSVQLLVESDKDTPNA
jgi:iron(III) transport system ATP-binding protein